MEPDIDHLRRWIGSEESQSEVVSTALVQRFNATFDLEGDSSPGAEAPPMIHLCLAPPVLPTADLGADGHRTRGGFLPPIPLPRRMWAGGEMRFLAPIRIGTEITRRSVVRDVTMKSGRSGALCFVTVEHEIGSGGALLIRERQDLVYRPLATGPAASVAAPAAPEGSERHRIDASPALLFRYSALTFNTHRIHYDAPYTREVEGYPGLIVHGPMQATMLVQLAARLRGRCPSVFGFRSLSPLFDTGDFFVNAADDGEGLRLWTAAEGGPVAMEARAGW